MTTTTLPPPSGPSQPFWDVSILDAGYLTLPLRIVLDPLPQPTENNLSPDLKPLIPSFAFLLRHSHSPTRTPTLFDLSISPHCHGPYDPNGPLSPSALEWVKVFSPIATPATVPEILTKGGVQPKDIEHVMISHLHWDHIGDPRWFECADFIVGAGAKELLDTGYPHEPESGFKANLFPNSARRFYLSLRRGLHWVLSRTRTITSVMGRFILSIRRATSQVISTSLLVLRPPLTHLITGSTSLAIQPTTVIF